MFKQKLRKVEKKNNFLQKGAISLSLIGLGVLVISAIALPLISNLVGKRTTSQQKAAGPSSVALGGNCVNNTDCIGNFSGESQENNVLCLNQKCLKIVRDIDVCGLTYATNTEAHWCRNINNIDEINMFSNERVCIPKNTANPTEYCSNLKGVCFLQAESPNGLCWQKSPLSSFCDGNRRIGCESCEVHVLINPWCEANNVKKTCVNGAVTTSVPNDPFCAGTTPPTTMPSPGACSGSCHGGEGSWDCATSSRGLGSYFCINGSTPEDGKGCFIDYEVKDSSDCAQNRERCYCYWGWVCSSSEKPASCNTCCSQSSPAPTTTINRTSCSNGSLESCDSWTEVDLSNGTSPRTTATIGDVITVNVYQHPGWDDDACLYGSLGNILVRRVGTNTQVANLTANNFSNISGLSPATSQTSDGTHTWQTRVAKGTATWNTAGLTPGYDYEFYSVTYPGHSNNCHGSEGWSAACCDSGTSSLCSGYSCQLFMAQAPILNGRQANHIIHLSAPTPTTATTPTNPVATPTLVPGSTCSPGVWDLVNCRRCNTNGIWGATCQDYGRFGTPTMTPSNDTGASYATWCSCNSRCHAAVTGFQQPTNCPIATPTPPAISCPRGDFGNLNCDNVINIADLVMLLDKWGTTGVFDNPNFHKADIAPGAGDGTVNMIDVTKLLDNWGAVPTPTR